MYRVYYLAVLVGSDKGTAARRDLTEKKRHIDVAIIFGKSTRNRPRDRAHNQLTTAEIIPPTPPHSLDFRSPRSSITLLPAPHSNTEILARATNHKLASQL